MTSRRSLGMNSHLNPQEPAAARLVPSLSWEICPSDRRYRGHKPKPSFLDDLAADIRFPVPVGGPPFFRALAPKQLLQRDVRRRAADQDMPARVSIFTRSPSLSLAAVTISPGNRTARFFPSFQR
jgi:hypothetical protein